MKAAVVHAPSESVAPRRCADCGYRLARANHDDCCYVCQRKRQRVAREAIARSRESPRKAYARAYAERLLTRRRTLRIPQGRFAEMLGVHRNTLGSWEAGKSLPDVYDAERIEALLSLACYERERRQA